MSEEECEKMKKPQVKNNTPSSQGRGGGGLSIKEDEEGKTVKVKIHSLGKENVKVHVVNNTLLIEGDDQKESDDDDDENDHKGNKKKNNNNNNSNRWGMYLPDDEYKCGELKAVMKNGVLTVVVPKKKMEERKDVMVVQVED